MSEPGRTADGEKRRFEIDGWLPGRTGPFAPISRFGIILLSSAIAALSLAGLAAALLIPGVDSTLKGLAAILVMVGLLCAYLVLVFVGSESGYMEVDAVSISLHDVFGNAQATIPWSEVISFRADNLVSVVSSTERRIDIPERIHGWPELRELIANHVPRQSETTPKLVEEEGAKPHWENWADDSVIDS